MIDGIPSNGWRSMNLLTRDLSRGVDMDKVALWAVIGILILLATMPIVIIYVIAKTDWNHAPQSRVTVQEPMRPKIGGVIDEGYAVKSREYNDSSIWH